MLLILFCHNKGEEEEESERTIGEDGQCKRATRSSDNGEDRLVNDRGGGRVEDETWCPTIACCLPPTSDRMVSFDHKILHGDMVARSRMIIDTQRAGAQQPAGGAGEDRRDG